MPDITVRPARIDALMEPAHPQRRVAGDPAGRGGRLAVTLPPLTSPPKISYDNSYVCQWETLNRLFIWRDRVERERDLCVPAGLCAHLRRVRHRPGQRLALPLYRGTVRRRRLCADLSGVFGDYGAAHHGHGVCRGAGQPEEHHRLLQALEPKGTKWHCTAGSVWRATIC